MSTTVPRYIHWSMWASSIVLIIGTLAMAQPEVAAQSPFPWVCYLVANLVWLWDSYRRRMVPWVILVSFLVCWDTLVIIERITGFDAFVYIAPWLKVFTYLL